jgi:recombination protein RecT
MVRENQLIAPLASPDQPRVEADPQPWQHAQPVALTRNVMRLTAPNPGMMTGPGTNSYVVGDVHSGYIVIDPGPNEPEHIARLYQATGGDIRMIVCTHSHSDHSPGALPLQALCDPKTRPPILGLPSAATARPGSTFMPGRSLQNKELLTLVSKGLEADLIHTLEVIHTPGHAANHLCLVLREDGLLFSGDHVLNGSTTVVDPPDGDMTDYLNSLDLLSAACAEHSIDYILPAHGYVIRQASQAIAHLKAHRLKREAKVRTAMQGKPDGSMDDWVALAYDDVSPTLWPIAKRSMLAHVQRLQVLR